MMQLMVKRRQVPDKKSSLVSETLSDGLAAFCWGGEEGDVDCKPQQILARVPRRRCKHSELDHSVSHLGSFRETAEEGSGHCEDDGSWRSITQKKSQYYRRAASPEQTTQRLADIRLGPASVSFKEETRPGSVDEVNSASDVDSAGRFAYISLDGRLINAELATSATSIGGRLGDQEAQAWEDFAPMQRVLIVAVSAAAAAEAKHRSKREIDQLLKAVGKRENELVLLRQELSAVCKHSLTNASQIHPAPLQLLDQALELADSPPTTPAQRESPVRRERSFDQEHAPVDMAGAGDSLLCSDFSAGDEAWAREEAKWYANPMVETSQDFYDISTPERTNSMFSICNPAERGSMEWAALRSSFATRDADHVVVESPSPVQIRVGNVWSYEPRSSQMVNDGDLHNEEKAMRAVCAAVVLDLRERMLAVLDKEASLVMAALQTSVDDAKTQIASMHLGVASCWNASVPKALAALSLSPSEFDSYLRETQGTSTWSEISKIEESIAVWKQYLETDYGGRVSSEDVEGEPPCAWSLGERKMCVCRVSDEELNSPCVLLPGCTGQEEDNKSGVPRNHLGFGCPKSGSAEELAEQLLGELDKAAAKVAAMERQMKKLEQGVAGSDGKATGKSAECNERDVKNQVEGREDVAELVRQLQSKEVEVANLKKGQQGKIRKIDEENIRSSNGNSRTTSGSKQQACKKRKFQSQANLKLVSGNILMKVNEPKALLDSKNKEIEELREDHKRRDAELDKHLAGAETVQAASADRLATLEELCKQKDSALSCLKQDLQSLESKVQGPKTYHSPVAPRALRNSTSSTPSLSNEYGTSVQKQRFSEKYSPLPSGSESPLLEHIGRFKKGVPNSKGHYRNLHYISTRRPEELTDDGRSEQGFDHETSQEYNSSPPGSTAGDACSVSSLAFSEAEVESRLGSAYCSSGEDSRNRNCPTDRFAGSRASSSYNRTLQKQKQPSSDSRRAVTSSSGRGLSRVPKKISTSATSASKLLSGEKHEATRILNINPL